MEESMKPDQILKNGISKWMTESTSPAIQAKGAYERAILFLRMLAGDSNWFDSYSRSMSDVFEMGDGDEVVRWILKLYNESKDIKHLVDNHSDKRQFLFFNVACEASPIGARRL
jgi:hypothetical protein